MHRYMDEFFITKDFNVFATHKRCNNICVYMQYDATASRHSMCLLKLILKLDDSA